jgi:hypothetical protein
MAKNGKGKAPEASDATDNSQAPGGSSITLEQLQAMMNTAREAARRNPGQCSQQLTKNSTCAYSCTD